MSKKYSYGVYALLWVSEECAQQIHSSFREHDIPKKAILRDFHLTVYHGRRPLSGLSPHSRSVRIIADTFETRFMVLAPGGENPRPELDPRKKSVGIRLTRRNQAITEIQNLRASISCLETEEIIGNRKRTSAWTSCFGSRHYQPHIKLLRPGSRISRDLTKIGRVFRAGIKQIEFDKLQVKCGPR